MMRCVAYSEGRAAVQRVSFGDMHHQRDGSFDGVYDGVFISDIQHHHR